jgi:hypothetical protein
MYYLSSYLITFSSSLLAAENHKFLWCLSAEQQSPQLCGNHHSCAAIEATAMNQPANRNHHNTFVMYVQQHE